MTQENRLIAFPSEETRMERIRKYQERKQRLLDAAKTRRLEKKELEKKILDSKIPIVECPLGCRPMYLAISPRDCDGIAKHLGLDWKGEWDLEHRTLYRHLNLHHSKEDISMLLSQTTIEREERKAKK